MLFKCARPSRSRTHSWSRGAIGETSMAASRRITITLPTDLVAKIDGIDQSRSRFISEAVRRELARHRRDELLRSITTPHPDAIAMQDISVHDWVEDLADDADVVDLSAGMPVRWIEGRGWVAESDGDKAYGAGRTRR